MSLINEALKRTRDNSFQTAPARPMTVETYRLSGRQSSSLGSPVSVWLSLVVVVLASAAVVAVALRVTRPSQQLRHALSTLEVESMPPAVAPLAVAPAVPCAPAPAAPAPEPPPAAPAPAPEPPKLVLQGVTSDATYREAMINGVNVREGENVDGARVVSIESRRVTLHFGDREIVLRMP
jgi:hypothetical protein